MTMLNSLCWSSWAGRPLPSRRENSPGSALPDCPGLRGSLLTRGLDTTPPADPGGHIPALLERLDEVRDEGGKRQTRADVITAKAGLGASRGPEAARLGKPGLGGPTSGPPEPWAMTLFTL